MTPRRQRSTAAAATALVAAAAFLLPALAGGEATDASPPTGAVGGARNPAAGTLGLSLWATDSGVGLANAEATLKGTSAFVRLGSGSCPEHPSPGAEPPSGSECPASVSAVPLALDTTAVPDGTHELVVSVTDAAGNAAVLLDRTIFVNNTPTATGTEASVQIGVGSKSQSSNPGKGEEKSGGKAKGKGLALRRKECRAPKLRMRLAKKPLWHTRPHHVPVLRYGRRYPYAGKLTCKRNGKRLSAPNGTEVGVYYRVWRLSFKHPWGPVKKLRRAVLKVKKGKLRIKLGFKSGRTLIFRYRSSSGQVARSKLRLAVPPRSRKPPWGPR